VTRETVARTGGGGRPTRRRASALPWMGTRAAAKCFRLGRTVHFAVLAMLFSSATIEPSLAGDALAVAVARRLR